MPAKNIRYLKQGRENPHVGNPQGEYLARNGLIGKIWLQSSMSEEEIMNEIRSMFADDGFVFHILQSSGGSSKSLMAP